MSLPTFKKKFIGRASPNEGWEGSGLLCISDSSLASSKMLHDLEVIFREHTIQRKTGTVEERNEPLSRLLVMSYHQN